MVLTNYRNFAVCKHFSSVGHSRKYFVIRKSDKHILEEFRLKKTAEKWAKEQANM